METHRKGDPLAISLPGDIVLDVARAADPVAVAEARGRLQRIAAGATASAGFEAPSPVPAAVAARHAGRGALPEAYVKFEGMVLQTFLQSMMPDGADDVYGHGMAGDMWKSLLARTLGETMAERGGIGIASRVLRDHYLEDGKAVSVRGVADAAQAARAETQDLISATLVHQMQRLVGDTLDTSGDGKSIFAGDGKA